MPNEDVIRHDKSMGEMGREAAWFVAHSVLAALAVPIAAFGLATTHPDPAAAGPKVTLTIASFVLAIVLGALLARVTGNRAGRYVWITALLVLAGASVMVIDMQTGPGLCEECGPNHLMLRLWRTFFDFTNGSGLMGGAGPLIGCWIPLALTGYAIGAALGAKPARETGE